MDLRCRIDNNELQPLQKKKNYWEIPPIDQIVKFNWPDFFENHYIETKTNVKYKLVCDTYHGNEKFEKV